MGEAGWGEEPSQVPRAGGGCHLERPQLTTVRVLRGDSLLLCGLLSPSSKPCLGPLSLDPWPAGCWLRPPQLFGRWAALAEDRPGLPGPCLLPPWTRGARSCTSCFLCVKVGTLVFSWHYCENQRKIFHRAQDKTCLRKCHLSYTFRPGSWSQRPGSPLPASAPEHGALTQLWAALCSAPRTRPGHTPLGGRWCRKLRVPSCSLS